jgi:thiamine biosynthesis lipoprotein ApbE
VDPRVLALLRLCTDLIPASRTGPSTSTVGPLLRAWGSWRRRSDADPEAIARARGLIGIEQIELDATACTVRLARRAWSWTSARWARATRIDLRESAVLRARLAERAVARTD